MQLAFFLTGGGLKPFYRMRDLILALDVVLSTSIIAAMLYSIALSLRPHALIPLAGASVVTVLAAAWYAIRVERRLRRRALLRPFRVEDINVGSAKLLRGEIRLGHVFVDSRKRVWEPNEREHALEMSRTATQWLEQQARLHDVALHIRHEVLEAYPRFYEPIPKWTNLYRNKDAFERLVMAASESFFKTGGTCLIVHVSIAMRSYACSDALRGSQSRSGFEYCVNGYLDTPGDYAHELLHLFGADDFYAERLQKLHEYRGELLRRSIMYSTEHLDRVRVDEMTAQNIGWI